MRAYIFSKQMIAGAQRADRHAVHTFSLAGLHFPVGFRASSVHVDVLHDELDDMRESGALIRDAKHDLFDMALGSTDFSCLEECMIVSVAELKRIAAAPAAQSLLMSLLERYPTTKKVAT